MKIDLNIIGDNEEEKAVLFVKEVTPHLSRIIDQLKADSDMLIGNKDDEITLLSIQEIVLFFTQKKKVYAKSLDKNTYLIKKRLYEIDERLKSWGFSRPSSGAIGNVKLIRKVKIAFNGGMIVVFVDGTEEFVSRSCVGNIKKVLKLGGK